MEQFLPEQITPSTAVTNASHISPSPRDATPPRILGVEKVQDKAHPIVPSPGYVERESAPGGRVRSPKQLQANRKNAQLSTGPKTPEGKSISARNAITHGLWAKEIVLHHKKAGEDPEDFAELHNKLIDDIKPQGAVEEMLVEKIAVCYWRLRRCLRAEHGAILRNLVIAEDGDLSMFAHPQKSAAPHTNGEYMTSLIPHGKGINLNTLLRYEASVQRQLDRALVQLERSQRLRNGEQLPAPIEILQT